MNNKVTLLLILFAGVINCNVLFLWLIPESVNNNVHTKIGLPLTVASMMVDPSSFNISEKDFTHIDLIGASLRGKWTSRKAGTGTGTDLLCQVSSIYDNKYF